MSTTLELIALRVLPASLRPFAKAVMPALFTLVAVGAQAIATGSFDKPELATAITGLSAAFVTFLTTNDASLRDEPVDAPSAEGLVGFAQSMSPEVSRTGPDEPEEPEAGDLVLTNGPRGLS